MKAMIGLVLLTLVTSTVAHAQARWVESWAAAPAAPQPESPLSIKLALAAPVFNNQTIIQLVRLSAGGQSLRLRFTNEYGKEPLTIGAVSLSLADADGRPIADGQIVVRFSGKRSVVVPPGSPWLSDPVNLPTAPLANVRVSIYLPASGVTCTCHMTGLSSVQVSPPGDFTSKSLPNTSDPMPAYRAFLSGVEVKTATATPGIIALGDSITDGFRSTVNTNHRWPDRLAERLVARSGANAPAVINQAVSGNRLLYDGYVEAFAQASLARFDRDVLSVPNARYLLLLEGINDIGLPAAPPSAQEMIDGYRQIIERAHSHGLKVTLATLLPFEGARYYRPEGDLVRHTVNAWMRTSGEADSVVDFDAVMRDPAHPSRMRADLQSGDWLHPNDAGYFAMGEAVNLDLFH